MKKTMFGMMAAILVMAMVSTAVWAEDASPAPKDNSSSVNGTLALVKNDKGEITGITITAKNGTAYNVDMTGFTQDVSALDGKAVAAKGEVKDVDGKKIIKITEDIKPTKDKEGPLGDLNSFKKIADDVLVLVQKNDLAAAKARIKDLETTWDNAEENLRKLNPESWKSVDKSIDRALSQLRSGTPEASACASALKTLIAKFDSIGKVLTK